MPRRKSKNSESKEPEIVSNLPVRIRDTHPANSLDLYLQEINRFPLLSKEEERALAIEYQKTGDPELAHRLVTANLRFVVKIAMQYSKYGVKLRDLIQEGNVGLMVAVKRFRPEFGFRLISYAVWWIRAYIQKHILDSWSLVRMGTTQAQRRLFSSMRTIQRRLMAMEGVEATDKQIAERVHVKEEDVQEMRGRLIGGDLSLNTPIDGESGISRLDVLRSEEEGPESKLVREDEIDLVQQAVKLLEPTLNEKEKNVLHLRLLADEPVTLQEIGETYQISRERVRQIEENLKKKLKEKVESLDRFKVPVKTIDVDFDERD